MKLLKITLLILTVLLYSCDDSEINIKEQSNDPDPVEEVKIDLSNNFGTEISRSFIGRIIDTDKNPIENASIKIGNSVSTTDENGVFMINDASVFERFAYITATKEGYINGSRTLIPTDGINKLTIMLLEKNVVGTVQSGEIASVSLSNGATVTLNGSYIDANGAAYNGSVDVILHHLDPASEDMFNQMPGSLYAATKNNEEAVLESFGMLAVELYGSNNEKLNLADNTTATITIPLDNSLLAEAPATIPLWYFDQAKGYWIEDGQATLQGDKYVGEVSHFTFWNTDINVPSVSLCINLVDENGNALANQEITLHNPDLTYPTGYGFTNETGQTCGLIPSNMTLDLNVISYDICGSNPIFTTTIGPFSVDTEITITIPTSTDIITETVSGIFNNCDDNAITSGYVILTYGNQTFFDNVDNGTFEINVLRCTDENTFSIEGVDYNNIQSTGEINYTFNTPTTNLGTISSCDSISEFIQYTIDDNDGIILLTGIEATFYENDPNSNNPTLNIGANSQNEDCFYLFGTLNEAPYVGSYTNYVNWGEIGINISECIDMATNNNNVVCNLTAIGDTGEYIDINFGGDYEDYNGNPHTISGIIHVIRDN